MHAYILKDTYLVAINCVVMFGRVDFCHRGCDCIADHRCGKTRAQDVPNKRKIWRLGRSKPVEQRRNRLQYGLLDQFMCPNLTGDVLDVQIPASHAYCYTLYFELS